MFFKKKADNVYRANINDGCLATDRISFDGEEVGYMYREHPDTDSETPDSGWRFFAGNETDEYINTPENIKNFSLDTICDYDPDIIPYLNSPYGSAWVRQGNKFVEYIEEYK